MEDGFLQLNVGVSVVLQLFLWLRQTPFSIYSHLSMYDIRPFGLILHTICQRVDDKPDECYRFGQALPPQNSKLEN